MERCGAENATSERGEAGMWISLLYALMDNYRKNPRRLKIYLRAHGIIPHDMRTTVSSMKGVSVDVSLVAEDS